MSETAKQLNSQEKNFQSLHTVRKMQQQSIFEKHKSSIPSVAGRQAELGLNLKSDDLRSNSINRHQSSPSGQIELFGGGSLKKKKKEKGLPYRSANRAKVRNQIQNEFLAKQLRSMQKM